jgi:cytochrome c-type biogenesis protein
MAVIALGVVPGSQRQLFLRLRPVGWLAAPGLGLIFALSWTPCLTPVLTTIALLGSSTGSFAGSCVAAVAYALGLSAPFFGMTAGVGSAAGSWSLVKRHQRTVHLATVAVLVVVGVLMISGEWTDLVRRTVTWVPS